MLSRSHRLTKAADFRLVGRRGKTIALGAIRLRYVPSDEPITRVGVVVPSRVSKKATVRNRIRRRIQAVLRDFYPKIRPGYWVVITVQSGAQKLVFAEIRQILESVFGKARFL